MNYNFRDNNYNYNNYPNNNYDNFNFSNFNRYNNKNQNNYNRYNNFNNNNLNNNFRDRNFNNNLNNNFQNRNFNNNQRNNYNNDMNYNQNLNNINEFPRYNQYNNSINRDINNFFRSELKSSGVGLSRGNSYHEIKERERERKKALMESFENQIALRNKTKLEELKRKKKEDQQYLKDMVNYFPFGRGGGGAPIRNKNGNVVTMRKDLISDLRYNLMQLNVDDDYNEVWGRNKNDGLINFKNENTYNGFVNNFSRSMSARNNNNFNLSNNEIYHNNYDNGQSMNRNFSYFHKINNNYRTRSTIPNYNENVLSLHEQNNKMNMNNLKVTEEFPNKNEYQYFNNSMINDYELNKIKKEEQYSRELLLQIKEHENRRLLEKKIKEEEDQKDEERLRKQNEELEKKVVEEQNKILEKQKNIEVKKQETKIRNKKSKLNLNEEEKVEEEEDEKEEEDEEEEEEEKEEESNESKMHDLKKIKEEKIKKLEQMEIEIRIKVNNELIQLRQQMQEQQNDLYNQIKFLKEQTHIANMERFKALKEIQKLKDEIYKQRNEEELRKQYIGEVLNNVIYEKYEFEKGEKENKFNRNLKYDEKSYYNKNINNFDKLNMKIKLMFLMIII